MSGDSLLSSCLLYLLSGTVLLILPVLRVYNAIAERLEADDYDGKPLHGQSETIDDSCCIRPCTDGSYGPVLVRLAWHASG